MSSRLVWFCAIYTACDMMSTCYLAGEILYDFYKQHCRRAKKRKIHQEINGCVEDLNQLFCEMARRGDVDYQNRDVPDHIADVYHRAMLL